MGVVMSKKYCLKTTVKHPIAVKYAGCVQPIDNITKCESFHGDKEKCIDYQKIKFNEAEAINLDCIAKKKNPSPPSVDFVVGLNNGMLLGVELKLNMNKTPFKNSTKQLKNKKQSAIKKGINDFVLIFCDNEVTKRYLNHIKRGSNPPQHGFQMMTLQDFKQTYF